MDSLNKWVLAATVAGMFFVEGIGLAKSEGVNLVANPSLETANSTGLLPASWKKDKWGTNTTVFTYPTAGYDGTKSAKVEIKSYTSGDAKWRFNPVAVTGGKAYIFSDYYQSAINSYLVAEYTLTNGTLKYVNIKTISPATSWTKAEAKFTTPTNAKKMTMYHLIRRKGTLATDNYSLVADEIVLPTATPVLPTPTKIPPTPTRVPPTPTPIPPTSTPVPPTPTPIPPTPTSVPPTPTPVPPTPTPIPPTPTQVLGPTPTPTLGAIKPPPTTMENTNLLGNPDFETENGNMLANWQTGNWGTNSATFSYPVAGENGGKAAKAEITGYVDGDAKWYADDINVNEGGHYEYKDKYQSSIPTQLIVRFTDGQGLYTYEYLGEAAASADWAEAKATFTVPTGIKTVSMFHVIAGNGFLTIDNASLKSTDAVEIPFEQGMVSLDFDDGWTTAYENGLPILANAGIKGTWYMVTGFVKGTAAEYIRLNQVLDLASKGQEIGSHTQTHPELPTLTYDGLVNEILGAKNELANMGILTKSFSYPYGAYNSQIRNLASQAGYDGARTADVPDHGFNYKNTDRYLLKTQSVESTTTLEQLKAWVDTAEQKKAWVILLMHQVDNNGGQYSITPANLQELANYIKSKNIKTVTASEGLALVNEL